MPGSPQTVSNCYITAAMAPKSPAKKPKAGKSRRSLASGARTCRHLHLPTRQAALKRRQGACMCRRWPSVCRRRPRRMPPLPAPAHLLRSWTLPAATEPAAQGRDSSRDIAANMESLRDFTREMAVLLLAYSAFRCVWHVGVPAAFGGACAHEHRAAAGLGCVQPEPVSPPYRTRGGLPHWFIHPH